MSITALREVPSNTDYKKGDVLVVFGELFSRGYANGIVEAAEKIGMKIVRSTVGRRDGDGSLRALNEEEIKDIPKPFINVPLEAGFDFEPASDGTTPVDQLSGVKLKGWEDTKLDWKKMEESQKTAIDRFQKNTKEFISQLKEHIEPGANVLFVHIMAGGTPRAKIVMPLLNRIVKGRGDRFQPSEKFWHSDIGKFCEQNFNEITADTFQYLVEHSSDIRSQVQSGGGNVSYVAYGYHGTEVLINGEYKWQSYSPYVPGWAKKRLEDHASRFRGEGIQATVYNCPEILTNSSGIFLGVEVPLYPLIAAYKKETTKPEKLEAKISPLKDLLVDDLSIDQMLDKCNDLISQKDLVESYDLDTWPQHNTQNQMEALLEASDQLKAMHKDPKTLITFALSEDIFLATGSMMLADSNRSTSPVQWIGHDVIAKQIDAWL